MLAASSLIGPASLSSQWWVTFAGLTHGFGHLVKLLDGRRLPSSLQGFEAVLADKFPCIHALRSWLPYGSLESLAQRHCTRWFRRDGLMQIAGSNALVALELFRSIL